MSVGAYLTIDIKIIKQNKFPCNCMLIRSYLFTKKNKTGITIAFRNITKYLVVCPVFLDDIKNMFYGRGITNFLWDRISFSTLQISSLFSLYRECFCKQPVNRVPFYLSSGISNYAQGSLESPPIY